MGAIESGSLKKRSEPQFVSQTRAELTDKLRPIVVETDLTQDLQTNGWRFIEQAFAEYGITTPYAPTQTFFISPDKLSQAEQIFEDDYQSLGGGFLPVLDWILIFLQNEEIFDAHSYFHENIHALGKVAAWLTPDQVLATRVGYSFSVHGQGSEITLQRGDFLEEATVNWLAARATVLYLRDKGVELPNKAPERYVNELAGGRPYTHMRDILLHLAQDHDELFTLFLQARFDLNLITKLSKMLSQLYGQGTLQALYHLDSRETQENDRVVMAIKPATQ